MITRLTKLVEKDPCLFTNGNFWTCVLVLGVWGVLFLMGGVIATGDGISLHLTFI